MRKKLGLFTEEEQDPALAAELLRRMAANRVDYSMLFRALCDCAEDRAHDARAAALFEDPSAFHGFAETWRQRLAREAETPAARASAMRHQNPHFIPRNHRIEQAIVAALGDDFTPFENLLRATARPYEEQADLAHLADPPLPDELVQATFCGT